MHIKASKDVRTNKYGDMLMAITHTQKNSVSKQKHSVDKHDVRVCKYADENKSHTATFRIQIPARTHTRARTHTHTGRTGEMPHLLAVPCVTDGSIYSVTCHREPEGV